MVSYHPEYEKFIYNGREIMAVRCTEGCAGCIMHSFAHKLRHGVQCNYRMMSCTRPFRTDGLSVIYVRYYPKGGRCSNCLNAALCRDRRYGRCRIISRKFTKDENACEKWIQGKDIREDMI